ncbi:hypothetical protein ACFE04_030455 [Oxalis oulophora]
MSTAADTSSTTAASGEKDGIGNTFGRTVKFVVFSGIAISVIKSINPFQNRSKPILSNDQLTPLSHCNTVSVTQTHANPVAAVEVNLNGYAQTRVTNAPQLITQLNAQPVIEPIPNAIETQVSPVSAIDVNLNGYAKTQPPPVDPQPITKLGAQQVTEAIPTTVQTLVSPISANDVSLNGFSKTQPPPVNPQPITQLDAQRVTEAIPKTIQNPNGPKKGQITPYITVDVTPGDTLWGLSKKHGVSVDAIKQANGLSGDTIYVGKKLIIP